LPYDTLVVAPGTVSEATSDHRLRSLSDALRLRQALDDLATARGTDRSVVLRVPSSCTWPAPAFELALLLAKWRSGRGLDDVRVTLAIEDAEPLEAFTFDAALIVRDALASAGVELLTRVPSHRLDQIPSTVAIDFGGLSARRVYGLPPVDPEGFYTVDEAGLVAPDAFVVGDAAATDYKAAFAAGWQARRVAHALGGDMSLLGDDVGGMPLDAARYEMDLGNGILRVMFAAPFAGLRAHELHATASQRLDGTPDKLAGTLTHAVVRGAAEREQALPMRAPYVVTRGAAAGLLGTLLGGQLSG
jgi:hypothetical protein